MDTLETLAKKHFGTTRNWNETGYILTDGSQLDFSGRHWGGKEIDVRNGRTVDHKDINEIIDDPDLNLETAPWQQFLNSGAIRIAPESSSIHLTVLPTSAQESALTRFIVANRMNEIYLDITDNLGHVKKSKLYKVGNNSAGRILQDIHDYFTKGHMEDSTMKNGSFPLSAVQFIFKNNWKYSDVGYEVVRAVLGEEDYYKICGINKYYKDVTFDDVKVVLDRVFDGAMQSIRENIREYETAIEDDGTLTHEVEFTNIHVCAVDKDGDIDTFRCKKMANYFREETIKVDKGAYGMKDSSKLAEKIKWFASWLAYPNHMECWNEKEADDIKRYVDEQIETVIKPRLLQEFGKIDQHADKTSMQASMRQKDGYLHDLISALNKASENANKKTLSQFLKQTAINLDRWSKNNFRITDSKRSDLIDKINQLDIRAVHSGPVRTDPWTFEYVEDKDVYRASNSETGEIIECDSFNVLWSGVVYSTKLDEFYYTSPADFNRFDKAITYLNGVRESEFYNDPSVDLGTGIDTEDRYFNIELSLDPNDLRNIIGQIYEDVGHEGEDELIFETTGQLKAVVRELANYIIDLEKKYNRTDDSKLKKDSAKITYYDPGRYTGPWENSYPEEVEVGVWSDLSKEELDPDEVWRDPDIGHISLDEAKDLFWKEHTRILEANEYEKAVAWLKEHDWDDSWFEDGSIEIRYVPEIDEYVIKDDDAIDMMWYLEHTGFEFVPYDTIVEEAWDDYNNESDYPEPDDY